MTQAESLHPAILLLRKRNMASISVLVFQTKYSYEPWSKDVVGSKVVSQTLYNSDEEAPFFQTLPPCNVTHGEPTPASLIIHPARSCRSVVERRCVNFSSKLTMLRSHERNYKRIIILLASTLFLNYDR